MEIVTGSTGEVHVTPIDDAVRNTNLGYLNDKVVFTCFDNFAATVITNNEVRISSGYGINQGRIFKIDDQEYDSVTIENGSQGYKRADLIVARYTMDTQTGFEDISLVAIRGNSGSTYIDPSYSTGDINGGDTQDDFPLYRVKINGLNIEAVERMFTLVPDGGRMGELEAKVQAHHDAFNALNIKTNLASESIVYPKNGANVRPGVEGVLPESHGGTGKNTLKDGAINLIGALDNNSTDPTDSEYYVGTTPEASGYQRKPLTSLWAWISSKLGELGYGDMLKGEFCNDSIIKPEKGGTGQTSLNATRNALGLGNNTTQPLQIPNGGTGATTAAGIRNAIGLGNSTGVLAAANGGTGQSSLQATRNAMGLGNTTGALPVANGGTGLTASPSLLVNLASTTAAGVMQASPRPGVTGTLPAARGGTGNTSLQATRNAMGLGNTTGALPVANGGTGATTVAAARNALGLGNTSGAVPIANGGTGQTTVAAARNALGLGNTSGAVPVANGGTGATSASAARTNLGAMSTGGGTFTGHVYSEKNIRTFGYVQGLGRLTAGGSLTIGSAGLTATGTVRIYSQNPDYYGDLEVLSLSSDQVYNFPKSGGTVQVSSPSSRRVKENVHDMTEERAKKLLDLDIVNFDYIGEFGGGLRDQSGVIAEDAVKVIPEAVIIPDNYDESKPIDAKTNPVPSVDYRQYIPYLIKMVQVQQKEIEELKAALNK